MTIEERIMENLTDLSAGQRKVAEYILENPEEMSYSTLAKISKKVGVSETTVIRSAYALGFNSYSEIQKAIQKEILGSSPRNGIGDGADCFAVPIFRKEIQLLENAANAIAPEELDRAVSILNSAEWIISAASRASYPSALWFSMAVSYLHDHVSAVNPGSTDMITTLLHTDEHTVLVCVSMARYARGTIRFARMAKERGAKIIAITDSKISPIAEFADIVFLAGSNRDESGVNTFSTVLAIMNVLIAGIRMADPGRSSVRFREVDKMYTELGSILE